MNTAPEAASFECGVQPILDILLPGHESELAGLRPHPWLATRIENLARKANEGELSPNEIAEYQGYARVNGDE